jgi:hypothetical protein
MPNYVAVQWKNTNTASRRLLAHLHQTRRTRRLARPSLAEIRQLILEAVPDVLKEWKWSTPVWSYRGILCTGESYKKAVKLTFAKGASLADPTRLGNASLEGNVHSAIDIPEVPFMR